MSSSSTTIPDLDSSAAASFDNKPHEPRRIFQKKSNSENSNKWLSMISIFFLVYIVNLYCKGDIPELLPLVYCGASGSTFILTCQNQGKPVHKHLTMNDIGLLLLVAIGGWPGVYAARSIYNIKSSNPIFNLALFLLSFFNLYIFKYVTRH